MSDTSIREPEPLLVDAKRAAALLSIGRSTFWEWVRKGKAPKPVDVNGLTRWRYEDLRQLVPAKPTTNA